MLGYAVRYPPRITSTHTNWILGHYNIPPPHCTLSRIKKNNNNSDAAPFRHHWRLVPPDHTYRSLTSPRAKTSFREYGTMHAVVEFRHGYCAQHRGCRKEKRMETQNAAGCFHYVIGVRGVGQRGNSIQVGCGVLEMKLDRQCVVELKRHEEQGGELEWRYFWWSLMFWIRRSWWLGSWIEFRIVIDGSVSMPDMSTNRVVGDLACCYPQDPPSNPSRCLFQRGIDTAIWSWRWLLAILS